MDKISILLVDDHLMFREGLRALLERQEGLLIVGEAGNAEEGVRLAAELKPDVILMDLHLPGRSGVDATRDILRRRPEARIIALSMYQDADLVESAVLAGARGYLLKDERAAVLVDGIRAVAAGGAAFEPHVGLRLLNEYRRLATEARRARLAEASLTPRDIGVLEHLAAGLSNRQIAERLFLSEQTIKNLLTGIYQKLGVQNRTEAVLHAVQQGLVRPPT